MDNLQQGSNVFAELSQIKADLRSCQKIRDGQNTKFVHTDETRMKRLGALLEKRGIVQQGEGHPIVAHKMGEDQRFSVTLTEDHLNLIGTIPEHVEITEGFKKGLENMLAQVKKLAPDANHALDANFKGASYKVWWNPEAQAVNVQKEGGYLAGINKGNTWEKKDIWQQLDKLGISESNDELTFAYNNHSVSGISSEESNLLEAMAKQVNVQMDESEAMGTLKEKFNPQHLNHIFEFFKSKEGDNHRYEASKGEKACKELLEFGKDGDKNILAWMRIEKTTLPGRGGHPPSNEIRYYINFQDKDSFIGKENQGSQDNKLGIQLNDDGEIISVYKNGKPSKADEAFIEGSEWNDRLTNGIQNFLQKHPQKET